MDITSLNFEEAFPKVKKSIEEATFLTIDCEFSGLNSVNNINSFDTIEQYYIKVRVNSKEFLVLQYGLSAFRYDVENNKFLQSSYNFYIFRRPSNRNIPDQRFLCQTSSIDFLISQGFDFNKLFKEGISYLNLDEENKYRKNLEEKHEVKNQTKSSSNENKIEIPASDMPYIKGVIEKIREYLKSGEEDPLELPKCNPFLRKLIYQTTSEMFGDRIIVETKQLDNKDRVMYVSPVKSKEELLVIAKRKLDDDLKILDESIGFTKVLRAIVDSGKLIVGHNLMLDLLHTIDKFLTPLPEDYFEFKECAHSLFQNVIDTKYICNSEYFKDLINSSVLGHVLDSVRQEPFTIPEIEIEDGCSGYQLDDKKEHEAGYDAFITGVCFLTLWNHLGQEKKLKSEEIFSNFNLLEIFMNKIFLMRLSDNPFIYLGGTDPNPSRDHVFHLTFPKDWKLSDIQQLFSPFGNVFISWISDISAYVGLYKRDQADSAYSTLANHKTCKIVPFNEYNESKGVSNTSLRRKCDESVKQNAKKLKTNDVGMSKKSPVSEKQLDKKKSKSKLSKTFNESDTWD